MECSYPTVRVLKIDNPNIKFSYIVYGILDMGHHVAFNLIKF